MAASSPANLWKGCWLRVLLTKGAILVGGRFGAAGGEGSKLANSVGSPQSRIVRFTPSGALLHKQSRAARIGRFGL
jgi:hypothetical protein